MKIAILNSKGGASKSTTAFQVASAYFLNKQQDVTLFEFDDENLDAENFTKTKIKTKQITVDDGEFLSGEITKIVANKTSNAVFDIGGNKTTTIWINALKKSRMYIGLNLIIIPISGGKQDVINAKKTYASIKDLNVPVIFCLSRARHPIKKQNRLKFQYRNFFAAFPKIPYFYLRDSDCVDLSRDLQQSIFEISTDPKAKEIFEKKIVECFENGDEEGTVLCQETLHIIDESIEFHDLYLKPAFVLISKYDKDK